jgi:hypothetical protein
MLEFVPGIDYHMQRMTPKFRGLKQWKSFLTIPGFCGKGFLVELFGSGSPIVIGQRRGI